MMDSVLTKLKNKKNLTAIEVAGVFQSVFSGKILEQELKDFLKLLAEKGESSEELYAAVLAVQEKQIPFMNSCPDAVDNCGTGGDLSGSFNISTAAALVAAAAGAQVIKHGNRAVSSQAGSADVLEALGILKPALFEQQISQTGFGFLFAPLYHPALKVVAQARRDLKMRTLFNLVGPLVNPANVKRQVVGVSQARYLSIFAEVLSKLGKEKAWVVFAKDGLDEITLTTTTQVCAVEKGRTNSFTIDPLDFGFSYCKSSDLCGGDARVNAKIIENILQKEKGPKRDVVLLNAAAVLCVADRAKDLKEGITLATQAIESGRAFQLLEKLRKLSQ